jgi:hypothetical protein
LKRARAARAARAFWREHAAARRRNGRDCLRQRAACDQSAKVAVSDSARRGMSHAARKAAATQAVDDICLAPPATA